MIKQWILIATLSLVFAVNGFCSRELTEKIDYFVEFKEKSPEMAAVLHVNFINFMPESKTAEDIVKQQLKIYGNRLKSPAKNIIGSGWYINEADPANPVKIKFQKDLGAYVWIGRIKNIVTFPSYINFLKKARNRKNLQLKQKKQTQEQILED
ncbi:MAG: hypothetical protein LBQ13_00960 [Endomicrobium sp.]|jgi:hypothetical protein|nr:hypothetical protein [Endomicrobium sp.]